MPEAIDHQRRRFFGLAALSVAAVDLGAATIAKAQSSAASSSTAKADKTFGSLKQVRAGVLDIGYAEAGPADGPAVLLVHGWPYDIHSFVDVAPILAAAGHRVIVPYLRGYGSTRFLSEETPRNGQQSALAVDMIALMDALGIDKAIVAGYDWGARTVNIMAALWPERCRAMVSVSGYLIGSQAVPTMTLEGDANGAPHPDPAAYAGKFTGKYQHRTLSGGIGHNLPQEAPRAFAQAVLDVARF